MPMVKNEEDADYAANISTSRFELINCVYN